MSAKIIDGKLISKQVLESVAQDFKNLKQKNIVPGLAVVLVGNDPASVLYVEKKQQACKNLGFFSVKISLAENVSEKELLNEIEKLNNDKKIHGILVQLPLPKHVNTEKIIEAISPKKDVDGFTSQNLGKIALGLEKDALVSCTPKGVIKLIESTGTEIKGKNVTVVGKSITVGKPLSLLLLNRNATLTVCDKFTKNLKQKCLNADILISATGKAELITKEMVKPEAVVLDVGTKKIGNKVVGDVVFEDVKEKASFITPVPGGVGPMTVACLMENTLLAAKNSL